MMRCQKELVMTEPRTAAEAAADDAAAKAMFDGEEFAARQRANETPEQELERLKEARDSTQTANDRLVPYYEGDHMAAFENCDRILAPGTVVQLAGVDVQLSTPTAAIAPSFKDEQVFAEHLAHAGATASFAANLPYFRNRYNANAALLGINPEHPHNIREARIAELEKEIETAKESEAVPAAS